MAIEAQAGRSDIRARNARRGRVVWLVLVVCTAAFLLLCGLVTAGLSVVVSGVTTTEAATIKAVPPSTLGVLQHNTTTPEQITGTTTLQEGDIATTLGSDEAFISLFGDSGTIELYPSSSIEIDRLRASRFFQNSKQVSVILHAGTITFATGDLGGYSSASYSLSTDQAEVDIAPDSFLRARVYLEQDTPVTEIVVNAGSATLRSGGKRIDLTSGQMASVSGTQPPQGPVEAQEELIHNGSFEDLPNSAQETVAEGGLGTAAWLPLNTGVATPPGSAAITSEVNLKAAVLTGEGSPDRYIKVGITQDINRPASFFSTIELSATVKLVSQAAPAGGPANDVYPLTIRIVYTDQFGRNHDWKRSFYYEGADPDLTDNSTIKITQGRWTTTQEMQDARAKLIESPQSGLSQSQRDAALTATDNLFVLKSPQQVADIAVINTIEVSGYGTQFQSWITNISLMAR